MLTLTRRRWRSIYSLGPRRGKWGIHGPWPDTLHSDRRCHPVAREGLVIRYLSDVRCFGLVEVAPDIQRRSDIRSLECVGRPAAVASVGWPFLPDECPGVGCPASSGHPVAEASEQLLLLLIALGVLAVLSMGFLLVPGHA